MILDVECHINPKTGLSRYHPEGVGIPPEMEATHFTHILEPYAVKHGLSINKFSKTLWAQIGWVLARSCCAWVWPQYDLLPGEALCQSWHHWSIITLGQLQGRHCNSNPVMSLNSRRTSTLHHSLQASRHMRTRIVHAHVIPRWRGWLVQSSTRRWSTSIAGMSAGASTLIMILCKRSRACTRALLHPGHCGLGAQVRSKGGSLCEPSLTLLTSMVTNWSCFRLELLKKFEVLGSLVSRMEESWGKISLGRLTNSRGYVTDDRNRTCTHSAKAKPEGWDEVRNCRCRSRVSTTWRLVTRKINDNADMSPAGLLLLVSREGSRKEVDCDPRMD